MFFVFRVLVGVIFFLHGLQKFGGGKFNIASLMGAAGIIEVVVGTAVVLGFFTRLAALLGGLEMIVAYLMVHIPAGLSPLENGGEPALLFFSAFLVLLTYGAGKWCLEKAVLKKEVF